MVMLRDASHNSGEECRGVMYGGKMNTLEVLSLSLVGGEEENDLKEARGECSSWVPGEGIQREFAYQVRRMESRFSSIDDLAITLSRYKKRSRASSRKAFGDSISGRSERGSLFTVRMDMRLIARDPSRVSPEVWRMRFAKS